LKILKLTNNNIRKIPSESVENLINLEVFHIDKNYFEELPTTLFKMKKLKEFVLEWFIYVTPTMKLV